MATKKKKEQPEVQTVNISAVDNKTGQAIQLPEMSPKQAILLFLWVYSGSTKDEAIKAQILETRSILEKGLLSMTVTNIDKSAGSLRMNLQRKASYSQELIDQHVATPWVKLAIAEIYGFKKEFLEAIDGDPFRTGFVKVARHGVKQLTGKTGPQIAMTFEEAPVEVEDYIEQAGLQVNQEDQ